ncbi:MAG: hypothetical protein AAF799_12845 [Myxococcota bacterium]
MRAAANKAAENNLGVIVDIRLVKEMTVLGRAGLRDLQNWMNAQGHRTAYITRSPQIRGAVLMAIHGHETAKACQTEAQALGWLEASRDRYELELAGIKG